MHLRRARLQGHRHVARLRLHPVLEVLPDVLDGRDEHEELADLRLVLRTTREVLRHRTGDAVLVLAHQLERLLQALHALRVARVGVALVRGLRLRERGVELAARPIRTLLASIRNTVRIDLLLCCVGHGVSHLELGFVGVEYSTQPAPAQDACAAQTRKKRHVLAAVRLLTARR